MSNTNVGSVYQKIIQDVGETSRVDFEESGVEEGVLEDLMKIWQAKLSSTGVAHFPWDPKPEPNPSPVINTPTAPPQTTTNYQQQTMAPPSASQQQPQAPLQQFNGMPQPNNNPNGNGVSIKQEPGLDASSQGPGTYPPSAAFNNAQSAHERAALNLQHTYGQRAAASINAIHNTAPMQQQRPMQMQMPMPHPQQPGQNGQQMQNHQQQQQMQRPNMAPNSQQAQEAYRQQMAQRTSQMMAAKNNNSVGSGQTDGADDIQPGFIGMISRVNAQGEEVELGRIEIDHMIRRRIEAMGQTMEGGGLMRPISRQIPGNSSKKRKVDNSSTSASSIIGYSVPQNDGPDDDDDVKDEVDIKDEDAINSDLDDPEEKDMDDDEEDEGANTMLCMYDKVQRVKNKWKCVMKDGVITVDGKEFVFHKATGEYEW